MTNSENEADGLAPKEGRHTFKINWQETSAEDLARLEEFCRRVKERVSKTL